MTSGPVMLGIHYMELKGSKADNEDHIVGYPVNPLHGVERTYLMLMAEAYPSNKNPLHGVESVILGSPTYTLGSA